MDSRERAREFVVTLDMRYVAPAYLEALAKMIDEAVAAEREACAKIAEDVYHWGNQCALQVAEGIRARSNNSN